MIKIMSFDKRWPKLQQPEFTTFRHQRGDRAWEIGEYVWVFYKARSKARELLGIAEIIGKELRELDSFFTDGKRIKPLDVPLVTDAEAIADGFQNREGMVSYLEKREGSNYISLLHKLTLRWVKAEEIIEPLCFER